MLGFVPVLRLNLEPHLWLKYSSNIYFSENQQRSSILSGYLSLTSTIQGPLKQPLQAHLKELARQSGGRQNLLMINTLLLALKIYSFFLRIESNRNKQSVTCTPFRFL